MPDRGDVLLRRRAPWLSDYVAELTSSPTSRYDDQPDSTAQALPWITETGFEPHLLQRIEKEAVRPGIAPRCSPAKVSAAEFGDPSAITTVHAHGAKRLGTLPGGTGAPEFRRDASVQKVIGLFTQASQGLSPIAHSRRNW